MTVKSRNHQPVQYPLIPVSTAIPARSDPARLADRRINQTWIISRIFGEGHWCTSWVIRLAGADPRFLVHVTEQTPDYVHIICLVRLALLGRPVEEDESDRHYAQMFLEHGRKELLRGLYDPCPAGLLGILPKLGNRPLSKNDYRRLVRLLAESNALKYLSHAKTIRPYHLSWLEMLPDRFRCDRIMKSIRNTEDYKHLKYLIDVSRTLAPALTDLQIKKALSQAKSKRHLFRWFRRQLRQVSFPPPPWPGNEWLKPATSVLELKQVKSKFDNCVLGFCDEVMLGRKYFYVSEQGPAVISLVRDPFLGWQLEDIKGIRNKRIPARDMEAIVAAFAGAGIEMQRYEHGWSLLQEDWDE